MIRWITAFLFFASSLVAEVTVDPDRVSVRDGWWVLEVDVGLSAITPYRVFTLDAPRRLVVDFQDVTFDQVDPEAVLSGDRATDVRFDPLRPGWSRMVVDLAEPLVVAEAGMTSADGGADLRIVLERAEPDVFAARSGAPPDLGWEAALTFDPAVADRIAGSGDFVVVLDPGHGGIDPGATEDRIRESDLMLVLAHETAREINAMEGFQAVLTRDDDSFLPLSTRLTIARQVGADLFISLHADALADTTVKGASVYTLSADGGSAADQRIVERHERGDLLAGVDLTATEDRVATTLMDLARAETGPEGRRFADALADALGEQSVRMNTRPRREGQFAVLTAADFPSVLVEAGFMSNVQDRAELATQSGRAKVARAIRDAVMRFAR